MEDNGFSRPSTDTKVEHVDRWGKLKAPRRAHTHKKIVQNCGYGSSVGPFLLDEAKQIDSYRLRACLCQNQPHFHAFGRVILRVILMMLSLRLHTFNVWIDHWMYDILFFWISKETRLALVWENTKILIFCQHHFCSRWFKIICWVIVWK